MRSVPRRERHRRLRNAKDCACRYHSPTPQIFDRLELLDQQLNYALPVGIISQAIITTDNYLGYSLSHYLFSGKRTLLNLPHRQSFLRLLQQLNVTFHDIF